MDRGPVGAYRGVQGSSSQKKFGGWSHAFCGAQG